MHQWDAQAAWKTVAIKAANTTHLQTELGKLDPDVPVEVLVRATNPNGVIVAYEGVSFEDLERSADIRLRADPPGLLIRANGSWLTQWGTQTSVFYLQ